MFKRNKDKPKKEKKTMWTVLGIESKKIRWVVRILLCLFMMFMLSAIGHSLSGNDISAIVMWCLSAVTACTSLGILIFKSNIS